MCRLFRISFVFVAMATFSAFGTEYDVAEQQQLITNLQSDAQSVIETGNLQKYREIIENEDPTFIQKISGLSEEKQIVQMRNYMAKKAFNYYYYKYMDELNQKSQKTGRQIKQERYKGDEVVTVVWSLDRGDLDKDKCKKNGFNICDYPDGFEEYEMSLTSYGNTRDSENFTVELIVSKDDVENNSSKVINIVLDANQYESAGDGEYMFDTRLLIDAICTTELYNDRQRWRNQETADVRAGKYRKPTKQEQAQWRAKYKGAPFGDKLYIVTDESRTWQSNAWLPDAAVSAITANYDSSYSHSNNQNKK